MRNHVSFRCLLFAAIATLSLACSTHTVGLAYKAEAGARPVVAPSARVAVGDFADNRHEPSHWIGAIRGGYGNPLKTLETDKSVSELVKDAFRQALTARGLYSDDGQFVLSGWIDKLDGDQYARKEATVQLHVAIIDRQTHREILNRPASSNQIEGSLVTMKAGIFGSVDELQSLIERVLSGAIDGFVDNSVFREAIQGSSATQPAVSRSFREAVRVGMPLIDLTSVAPKAVSAIDRLDQNGKVVGKTLTYESGGETIVITVENGVVTAIALK
jgi:hypothetical protein